MSEHPLPSGQTTHSRAPESGAPFRSVDGPTRNLRHAHRAPRIAPNSTTTDRQDAAFRVAH
ncbi:AbfB domain-containing protein [Streptomyces sp. NPDC001381]|uniref:AbfB domain-containing protein n=1 Tax=Streptomyces sp. NPDC001381 TaxID=3364567 RepID=UPI0036A75230